MENGIFFTPSRLESIPNVMSLVSGRVRLELETLCIKKKWTYGFSYMSPKFTHYTAISVRDNKDYCNTEDKAKKKVALAAIKWFSETHEDDVANITLPEFILNELEKLTRPKAVQLSLFD